jgi:hypothetical protein
MDNPNGLKNVVFMVVFPHFLSLNYLFILQKIYKLKMINIHIFFEVIILVVV